MSSEKNARPELTPAAQQFLERVAANPAARSYTAINPTTGAPIVDVPDADESDMNQAIERADAASDAWGELTPRERAAVVREAADRYQGAREELAQLDAIGGGNPVDAMRKDVDKAADYMRLMADYAAMLQGDTVPASRYGLHYTERLPYGTVLRITPYNHPAMFAAEKVAAPLVAGNSVVLKVAEQTPLSAMRMAELWQDLFPENVFQVITGHGPRSGQAGVRHTSILRIAFTGSPETGRAIVRDAAEHAVKHVSLELGGKNAMIVFPDADRNALDWQLVEGMNLTSSGGQSCGSTSRIFVHRSIYAEIVERTVELYRGLRVGDPLDESTQLGPQVSEQQMFKVLGYVDIARNEGAKVGIGGSRPTAAAIKNGFFVEPTVLYDIDHGATAVQNEIFGPVVSILPFDNEDDVIAAANGVRYGLTGSIWTQDLNTAHRVAHRLDTGYIWINGTSKHYLGLPFGGFKDSGLGREESLEELLSYTRTKSIHLGNVYNH